MTRYLDPDQVEALLIEQGFHIRSRPLLLSALAGPMPVFGEEVYPTISEKAAVLLIAIARNHPMIDGNKRSAWLTTNAFLYLNGIVVNATTNDKLTFMVGVAEGTETQRSATLWFRSRLEELE